MKTRFIISLGAALTLFTACIPSLEPFYQPDDVQFDPRLLGKWRPKAENSDDPHWQFEAAEDKAYKLTIREKEGKQGTFSAHLFKLNQHLLLDIVALEFRPSPEEADLVTFSMFTGHLVLRVAQVEPTLKLAYCDYDWLAKFLENNPNILPHRIENKRAILKATTQELQRFVLQHTEKGELFAEPDEYVRETDSKAPAAKQ